MDRSSSEQALVVRYHIPIYSSDIAALTEGKWINDNIINVFLMMIAERNNQSKMYQKVHVMNTFFMKKLMQSGYDGVKKWTKNVEIFNARFILIPFHNINHWSMIIVDNCPGTIKMYDSDGHQQLEELKAVKFYLECEDKTDSMDWIIEVVEDCPRQKNNFDCGIFTLIYAEFVTRLAPLTFTQEDVTVFRKKIAMSIVNGEFPDFIKDKSKKESRCVIS